MKIKWLRIALNDINEIAEFIKKDNPAAARKIVQIIYKKSSLLKEHPEIGRPGRVAETREMFIPGTPFIIPYRVKNNNIEILRVLHASRKWPDEF